MSDPCLPFFPEQARKVRNGAQVHHQQPVSRREQTASDFYQQVMLKHPYLSQFCSRAAYLHAGLLEGDPHVQSYTPRPYRLWVGKHTHVPTCLVTSSAYKRQLIEITSDGTLADALRLPLTQYFALQAIDVVVISAAAVLDRQVEAENWLLIVSTLHRARDIDVGAAELDVMMQLTRDGPRPLGAVIDPGDRDRTYDQEIALLRLLHRGQVRADLGSAALDFDTVFTPCV